MSTDNSDVPVEFDTFTGQKYLPCKLKSPEDAKAFIRENLHEYSTAKLVFRDRDPESLSRKERALLFEQYKEMFASTESLMVRRQNTSSFYISINTALVAIVTAVFALGLDITILCAIGIAISFFGIMISKTWAETLESYDRINYSKFNVLEAMEKYLPASMFYAEYKDSKNDMVKRSVPSYSARERKIPMLFMTIYVILGIFLGCVLVYLVLTNVLGWTLF